MRQFRGKETSSRQTPADRRTVGREQGELAVPVLEDHDSTPRITAAEPMTDSDDALSQARSVCACQVGHFFTVALEAERDSH
jgi:hypothetical protein